MAREVTGSHPYSRYPVTGDNFDDILGFVHVRDLFDGAADDLLGDLARPIPFLPVDQPGHPDPDQDARGRHPHRRSWSTSTAAPTAW